MNNKSNVPKKNKISFSGSSSSDSLSEENLESVTGGGAMRDYFDPVRCFLPRPDSRCRIRDSALRCVNLSVKTVAGAKKYRYVCAKGCFDYISDVNLHE